jgi:acetyl-CoA acetyltransferase
MAPFSTPKAGARYTDIGARAVQMALQDAGIEYDAIEQAYAGYVFGDSACGQRVLYQVGVTGIPIVNVNNYCATGSTALFLARQAVASGACDCALAVGFEQMTPGALTSLYQDRPSPIEPFANAMTDLQGWSAEAPRAAQFFGGAGREYMQTYGLKPEVFGMIAVKARQHAARNPNAVFRDPLTLAQVMASAQIFAPLTRFQCCPPTSGAAAAVVCSESFAHRLGNSKGIHIAAQVMVTDRDVAFRAGSMLQLVGYDMSARAAARAYESSGVDPQDLDVVELHDCFTTNELISYEALALTPPGTAERMVLDGDNTYGGRYVINPSGGLLSKGHPLGATGLAQCSELVWQLRGTAAERQVEGARVALQHNIGLGGACVVTIYQR